MCGFNLFSRESGQKRTKKICQHSGPWHHEEGIRFSYRTCIHCGYFETQDSDLAPVFNKLSSEQGKITSLAS